MSFSYTAILRFSIICSVIGFCGLGAFLYVQSGNLTETDESLIDVCMLLLALMTILAARLLHKAKGAVTDPK